MARESLPRLACACANLRRTARVVTQLYEAELQGTGLRVTQLTLLRSSKWEEQPRKWRWAGCWRSTRRH